jgi:transposase IS4-like protein
LILALNVSPECQPELWIPPDVNIDDPYALFSLFWPEDIWYTISHNTNMYAIIQRTNKPLSNSPRPWSDTSVVEIKVFIGILIYMGIHDLKRTDFYWKNKIESGPIHTPQLYMSLTQFEQIKRYLHISQPLGDNVDEPRDPESATQYPDEYMEKMWWHKVLPLADIFRDACQKYYTPGTNIAIDELMIQCYGHSLHTYKMPNKPIQQGYKLFVLAEHSYIWWFIWSSRKYSFKAEVVLRPDLTATGSMVYHLVKHLLKFSRVYLENYFTSIPLFRLLHSIIIIIITPFNVLSESETM